MIGFTFSCSLPFKNLKKLLATTDQVRWLNICEMQEVRIAYVFHPISFLSHTSINPSLHDSNIMKLKATLVNPNSYSLN